MLVCLIAWFKYFGSWQIQSLPFDFPTVIKGFTHLAGSLTGSTMSSLCILPNSNFSVFNKVIGIFLAEVTAGVKFWLIVVWWTLESVPISPQQSLYSFKKLCFWELEMNFILLISFNCLLEFSPVMGREFVSAIVNKKGTFLLRCWISKVHSSFTGILLLLNVLRVVADCYYWFYLQSFNLVYWNYIDLSTRVEFVAEVGPIGIECDWKLNICHLGDCVLLVAVFDFIWYIKYGTKEETVFI